MTSSTWLICSGMLSGLVGTYWMTLAPSCLAAFSAPTRTFWKNGLVWFLVKTAVVSPSARARPTPDPIAKAVARIRAFFVWAESNSPQEDSQKGGVERVFGV